MEHHWWAQNLYANSSLIHQKQCLPPQIQWRASSAREEWEERDCREKEQMMGYMADETECQGALVTERSMRLGRVLDANVMLHLGAMLFDAHA